MSTIEEDFDEIFSSDFFRKSLDKSKADADQQAAKKWVSEQKYLTVGMNSLSEMMAPHLKIYQQLSDEENHLFWRLYLFKTAELIFKFSHQSIKYPNTEGAAFLRETRTSIIQKLEEAEQSGYNTCGYIEKLKTLKL